MVGAKAKTPEDKDLYGVTYRSKFSQSIFSIDKSIFMSEIN